MVARLGSVLGTTAFADAPPAGDARGARTSQTVQALKTRLAADKSRAVQLENKIAATQDRSGGVRVADLFGESDKEKQERLQHEQAEDSSVATLNERVNDLENTLRQLTGQMEQLDHRVSEFDAKIARMQKDFDYKLCTLSAQQLSAGRRRRSECATLQWCPGPIELRWGTCAARTSTCLKHAGPSCAAAGRARHIAAGRGFAPTDRIAGRPAFTKRLNR